MPLPATSMPNRQPPFPSMRDATAGSPPHEHHHSDHLNKDNTNDANHPSQCHYQPARCPLAPAVSTAQPPFVSIHDHSSLNPPASVRTPTLPCLLLLGLSTGIVDEPRAASSLMAMMREATQVVDKLGQHHLGMMTKTTNIGDDDDHNHNHDLGTTTTTAPGTTNSDARMTSHSHHLYCRHARHPHQQSLHLHESAFRVVTTYM